MSSIPLAHAQWFVDPQRDFPVDWGSLGSTATLAALAAVAGLLAAIVVVSPSVPRMLLVPVGGLRRWADHAPAVLAATLGLGMIGMTALGDLWMRPAPNSDLGTVFLAVQAQIGIWVLLGVGRAAAALAVVALTALVAVAFDPVAVLTAAYVPAAALALLALTHPAVSGALPALRIGMGVALIAAAFAEKLAAPDMTVLVLQAHPQLDLVGAGPETFTLLAGSVELLLGGLLLSGVAAQVVALAALGPMVATVPIFGVTEVVGHLPIYGVLLAIAVLDPVPTRGEVAS